MSNKVKPQKRRHNAVIVKACVHELMSFGMSPQQISAALEAAGHELSAASIIDYEMKDLGDLNPYDKNALALQKLVKSERASRKLKAQQELPLAAPAPVVAAPTPVTPAPVVRRTRSPKAKRWDGRLPLPSVALLVTTASLAVAFAARGL